MEFRLFPEPSENLVTPYRRRGSVYHRFDCSDHHPQLVTVSRDNCGASDVRAPDRERLLEWLGQNRHTALLEFARKNIVVPTFSCTESEALTRVFCRQIVTVLQARRLFHSFVVRYGYEADGYFGFPNDSTLSALQPEDFRELGLGFRGERLHRALSAHLDGESHSGDGYPGVGPWSRAVLDVDLQKDYAYYPFSDKSGEAVAARLGIDLSVVSLTSRELAGDLYVYAVSMLNAGVAQ